MASNKDNLIFEKTSFLHGNNSPFIKDLDRVESRLSKYIPGIINKIIHFSEVYEKKNCNNKVSNNTIILRKLYSKIINANIYSSDGDVKNHVNSHVFLMTMSKTM